MWTLRCKLVCYDVLSCRHRCIWNCMCRERHLLALRVQILVDWLLWIWLLWHASLLSNGRVNDSLCLRLLWYILIQARLFIFSFLISLEDRFDRGTLEVFDWSSWTIFFLHRQPIRWMRWSVRQDFTTSASVKNLFVEFENCDTLLRVFICKVMRSL